MIVSDTSTLTDPPVTVTIIRHVKPGCELAFERLVRELAAEARQYNGHLGANIFRPNDANFEYHLIDKFDSLSHYHQWEKSTVRAAYYQQIEPLLVKPPRIQIISGLETWFDSPTTSGNFVPPPRYKMAIASWLAIYPLVVLILESLNPLLKQLNIPCRALLITMIAIPTMTYVLMPQMVKLLNQWLYPSK